MSDDFHPNSFRGLLAECDKLTTEVARLTAALAASEERARALTEALVWTLDEPRTPEDIAARFAAWIEAMPANYAETVDHARAALQGETP